MTALSPEFSRTLALLLLLSVILAVYGLAVEPMLVLHRQLDAEWHDGSTRLTHYQRVAATLAALKEAQAGLHAAATGPAPYVTAESETLAVAELQETVSNIVQSNGAQLIGTRVLDTMEEGGFQRIGLRVTLTATLAPLQATLYQLEAHLPIFFIDDLSIQRRDGGTTSGEADPVLDVAFDLLVYRQEAS